MSSATSSKDQPFLTDVKELRNRARKNLEQGALTPAYGGDVKQAIDILQSVLATEIVCVLRYTQNAVAATGIASESVREEFDEHANEERKHMRAVAERINQLGGEPNFSPEGILTRSASQYAIGKNLVEMIKENLIAERIVQLGGVAEGTVRLAAAHSGLPEYPLGISDGREHVEALSHALAYFGERVRAAIGRADSLGDRDTADILTEVSRGVDQNTWFVEAHGQAEK